MGRKPTTKTDVTDPQECPRTILVYLDGSGTHPESDYLTLAAFGGAPDAWAMLDARWQGVVSRRGWGHVHMRELVHQTGGWRFAELLNEALLPTLEAFPHGFGGACCTVDRRDYHRACGARPTLRARKDIESLCVDSVVHTAGLAFFVPPEGGKLPEDAALFLYFDRGEPFMHRIRRIWEQDRRRSRLFASIKEITPCDAQVETRLQPADFVAWHANRAHTHKDLLAAACCSTLAGVYRQDYNYDQILERLNYLEGQDRER